MLAVFLAWRPAPAFAAEVVDLKTRPGVSQRILVLGPRTPAASVLLFAGGSGKVIIRDSGDLKYQTNFLVRSRHLFADAGLAVAVIDAPSDRNSGHGLNDFRTSPEHRTDVRAVIAYMRKRFGAPVWLVGTSRGTVSAAAGALLDRGDGPDGVVLTASVTRASSRRPVNLDDVDLGQIRVPVLVVHHKDDECQVTPFEGALELMERLTAAPNKELIAFEGGAPGDDNPCRAMSHHGFLGIEDRVVRAIAEWIKAR